MVNRTAAEDPGAPFMNDTMKYVVSSTLEKATWRNSEVVGPYDPAVIRRLKDSAPGGLYVSGSGTLVRAMIADGLVDELHLFVYPVTLGTRAAAVRGHAGREVDPGREPGLQQWRAVPAVPRLRVAAARRALVSKRPPSAFVLVGA